MEYIDNRMIEGVHTGDLVELEQLDHTLRAAVPCLNKQDNLQPSQEHSLLTYGCMLSGWWDLARSILKYYARFELKNFVNPSMHA